MEFFNKVIPITVFVALSLFVIREILDFLKKRREDNRKVEVYKMLIAEEIRHNLFVFDQLCNVSERIIEICESKSKDHDISVKTDRYKNEYIQLHSGKESGHSIMDMWFKQFSYKNFESHISELALIDRKSYTSLNQLYSSFRIYENTRNTVVCFLAKEMNDVRNFCFGANLRLVTASKDSVIKSAKEIHLNFTGKTLELKFGEYKAVNADPTYNKSIQPNAVASAD